VSRNPHDHRADRAVVGVFSGGDFPAATRRCEATDLPQGAAARERSAPARERLAMHFVSADEKAQLEKKREELYKTQLDVQERIRKAAALGDLSENAEYHFAKEENRSIQRQLAELEAKLKSAAVVSNSDVPEDMVFIGHTVKLLDLDDDSEQLVRLVGEAVAPDANSDVLPVSATSPMGESLMKARVGDKIKVKAPRGTMEFKILEIL
jgi:transcription elongation factor GreA